MTTIPGGSAANYISEGDILAWVEQQQDVQYGQLRGAMDFETSRGKMLEDLSVIKKLAKDAAKDANVIPELDKAIKEFAGKYCIIDDFEHIAKAVTELAPEVSSKAEELSTLADRQATYDADPPTSKDRNGNLIHTKPRPTAPGPLNQENVDKWAESVTGLSDNISHNQDLAMIRVGELRNTVDNIAKTGSQLLKSGNDTASLIINNFA
jgi:methyl-accepting chemotaxis protein